MQSVFEKINERLEETENRLLEHSMDISCTIGIANAMTRAIEIVNQVAEEVAVAKTATTNDGWIPCSQKMPKEKGMYLVSYGKNTQVIVESYNGVWFDEHYYCEQPKAWMHRPAPYQQKGE